MPGSAASAYGPVRAAYERVDAEHAHQGVECPWPVRRRVHEDVRIDHAEVAAARGEPLVMQRRQPRAGDEADPYARREIAPGDVEGPPGGAELVDVADHRRPPPRHVRRGALRARMDQHRAIQFSADLQGRFDEFPRSRGDELARRQLQPDEAGLEVVLQLGEVGIDARDRRPGPKRCRHPDGIAVVGREERVARRKRLDPQRDSTGSARQAPSRRRARRLRADRRRDAAGPLRTAARTRSQRPPPQSRQVSAAPELADELRAPQMLVDVEHAAVSPLGL